MAFRDAFEGPTATAGGHTIQDEGVDLPARARLNFGAGLSANDDEANDATVVWGVVAGRNAQGLYIEWSS